jgi:hypothetical protein
MSRNKRVTPMLQAEQSPSTVKRANNRAAREFLIVNDNIMSKETQSKHEEKKSQALNNHHSSSRKTLCSE